MLGNEIEFCLGHGDSVHMVRKEKKHLDLKRVTAVAKESDPRAVASKNEDVTATTSKRRTYIPGFVKKTFRRKKSGR